MRNEKGEEEKEEKGRDQQSLEHQKERVLLSPCFFILPFGRSGSVLVHIPSSDGSSSQNGEREYPRPGD